VVGVGQTLGDDALTVGVRSLANLIRASAASRSLSGRWCKIDAVGGQKIETTQVRRRRLNRSLLNRGAQHRPALAIEHMALRQQVKHLLEAPHHVAVARDQAAANDVAATRRSSNLTSNTTIGMVKRLCAHDLIINVSIPDGIFVAANSDKSQFLTKA
jgi:hypothetical protein